MRKHKCKEVTVSAKNVIGGHSSKIFLINKAKDFHELQTRYSYLETENNVHTAPVCEIIICFIVS